MQQWGQQVFTELGMPADDAELVTETLLLASLRGVDSHGLMRIPIYCERLMAGGVNPTPNITIVQETAGTAIVDGDHGMGQVVAKVAMQAAIDKAREVGTSFVVARRTNHFGAAGYWAEMALRNDMIGWATTNTPPIVAPWGSKQPVIGNNPIAISAPAANEQALQLDMALSMVAGGKLRYAARKGVEIPNDWALDPEGHATTDPVSGLAGVLLPTGRHKGSGLSIMVETLTGLLAGTGWSDNVQIVWEKTDTPGNVASSFGAIDIASFIEPDTFKRSVDGMVTKILDSDLAPGTPKMYVPGGPETETQERRLEYGVPLPAQVIKEMRDLGVKINVNFDIREGDGL